MVGFGVSAVSLKGKERPALLAGEQISGGQNAIAGDWRWAAADRRPGTPGADQNPITSGINLIRALTALRIKY